MPGLMTKSVKYSWLAGLVAAVIAMGPARASAQAEHAGGSEAERAATEAAGDSAKPNGPGSEHHEGGGEEAEDPSKHFNFVGMQPGHLFDYGGKDEYGGRFGDGEMTDPQTGHKVHEEEPASPPFIFMLFNFALLLALLAWKGRPVAEKIAQDRHDQIKSALDEAARLRKEAADKLADYDKRLKAADAEIQQMIDGMRADAESEKQRILAAAETQAQQMKRDAEQRIAAEIELARTVLTREVTAAAAAATEKLLHEKMTAGDQQKLVTGFIAEVQSAGQVGRSAPQGDR